MKKVRKGDYGYIGYQKKLRFIRTLLCFALPILFFCIGLYLNQGDRKNIYTVIAIVGSLPACMSVVNMLMMWMRKPMDEGLYKEISADAGNLTMAYELYVTTYSKNLFIDAAAFCGEYVMCYTHEEIKHADLVKIEDHLKEVFRNSGYNQTVKIYQQKKGFLERIRMLSAKQKDYEAVGNENFTPYDKYPDLTRSEVMKHLTMAVSL